ncbi:hypothetical protein [Paraglaciecola psychrophila]|uniref:hypothetical protein n=1 Tax=Paraglaciecola psychrophila TaxID=326544 RepID=UPI00054E442A|nr:hypothetical protein [Paraglaciecola psychrophila]
MKTQILILILLSLNITFSFKIYATHITYPVSSLITKLDVANPSNSYASLGLKKPPQVQGSITSATLEDTIASLGLKKPPQLQGSITSATMEDTVASLGLKKPPYEKYI